MSQPPITILGIESSCDETAAAIIQNGKILANIIANQDIHKAYGGVVPELASRAHQQNIVPVVSEALKKAGITKKEISGVAFTRGPGLLGALLVGTSFAKAFAMGLNIPLIEVNHMHAHILAHFIEEKERSKKPSFPFLCLTVSGGHTQIVLIKDFFEVEVLGETIDDAAGEAFDKVAKIMGLPYPGGPLVDKYAKKGNANKYKFPHPNAPGLNFSFSGLKTSFLYFIKEQVKNNPLFIEQKKEDICASIQAVIVAILISKLKKAAQQTGIREIAIAGGVSANTGLRMALEKEEKESGWNIFIPKFEYCTDNAAMIAVAGYYKFLKKDFADQHVSAAARYSL